jgi:hypothetical protein
MSDSCVFTIVSKNYISHARVLIKSFLNHHTDVKTFVLLADKIDGYFDTSKEAFEVIEADSLDIDDFDSFSFKYNIAELNTAVKPFFFEYLFSRYGFKKIVYLDPDIVVFRELTEIFELLDKYSILLTPHITKPVPDDGFFPSDIDILRSGCFNLGFIGLSKRKNVERLISWWKERLYDKCLMAPISGYMVDQIWISFVPSFFDDYFLLKNPGYNVAYWNLHERSITKKDGDFMIDASPLYFFHFSGFEFNNLENISKYQNRFRLLDIPELKELLEMYKGLLIENGYNEVSKWPYYYGFFKNGSRIPEIARSIYWGLGVDSKNFGNPFNAFYLKLLNRNYLKAIFRRRFLFAMMDKISVHVGKKLLSKRKRK